MSEAISRQWVSAEKGLREYWGIICQRWYLVAFSFILFVVAGVLYTARQPRLYRSTAVISITPPRLRTMGKIAVGEKVIDTGQDQAYINTLMETIRSRDFIESAFKGVSPSIFYTLTGTKNDLSPDLFLAAHFSIMHKKNTHILYLHCIGLDAESCRYLVDLIARKFIEINEKTKEIDQEATLEWLKKEIPKVRKNISKTKETLLDFEKKNKEVLFYPQKDGQYYSGILERLRRELDDIDVQLTKAKIRYEQCKKMRASGKISEMLSLKFLEQNRAIEKLRMQQFELENELAEHKLLLQEKHPQIISLNQRIEKWQQKILSEIDMVMRREEQKYRELEQTKEQLQQSFENHRNETLLIKEKFIQYEYYRQEYQALQKTYVNLVDKMKELDIFVKYHVKNIRYINRAIKAKRPYKPNKLFYYALSVVLGMIAGLSLVFLLELLDETIKDPAELEKIAGSSVLGVVPFMPNQKRGIAVEQGQKGYIVEAFRTITTSLLLDKNQTKRRILITSPRDREGKTTIVCNLAITMAGAGYKVLAIDGDLHRPCLHKELKVDSKQGLSQLLEKKASLEDILCPVKENLWCIPAGKIPENSYDLLYNSDMKKIFDQMLENYDIILVDSPPVGLTSDALLLAEVVPEIVMVASILRSPKSMLEQIIRRLQKLEFAMPGYIVNDQKGKLKNRQNYYHYYRSYS